MEVLVRIFLRESERFEDEPLQEVILRMLNSKGVSGATFLKAVLGYGISGKMHYEGIESLSYDLPVVIEFVEEETKANKVLEDMETLLKNRLVILEKAEIWG